MTRPCSANGHHERTSRVRAPNTSGVTAIEKWPLPSSVTIRTRFEGNWSDVSIDPLEPTAERMDDPGGRMIKLPTTPFCHSMRLVNSDEVGSRQPKRFPRLGLLMDALQPLRRFHHFSLRPQSQTLCLVGRPRIIHGVNRPATRLDGAADRLVHPLLPP